MTLVDRKPTPTPRVSNHAYQWLAVKSGEEKRDDMPLRMAKTPSLPKHGGLAVGMSMVYLQHLDHY